MGAGWVPSRHGDRFRTMSMSENTIQCVSEGLSHSISAAERSCFILCTKPLLHDSGRQFVFLISLPDHCRIDQTKEIELGHSIEEHRKYLAGLHVAGCTKTLFDCWLSTESKTQQQQGCCTAASCAVVRYHYWETESKVNSMFLPSDGCVSARLFRNHPVMSRLVRT